MTAPMGVLRALWRLRLAWRRLSGRTTTVDMSRLTDFYRGIWQRAAANLAADFAEIGHGVWSIQLGSSSVLVSNYLVPIDNPVTLSIGGDKGLCHRLLSDAGLPVPEHLVFTADRVASAIAFMKARPGGVFVVKPSVATSGSRGVTTLIQTERECRSASALASLYGADLLIERWIPGEPYRLLFLDGELIHASRRRGLWVEGDGHTTVGRLVDGTLTSGSGRFRPTRDAVVTLASQGLDVSSVPAAGHRVLVQSARTSDGRAEIRTVFDDDATREIGDELRRDAARAACQIGSRFAGIDVITRDPSVSLLSSGGVINEINTTPGLHHHYNLGASLPEADPTTRVLAHLLGLTRLVPQVPRAVM